MNIETNEFHGVKICDTFQDMSKVANYIVSNPLHCNIGGGNQSNKIHSHMIWRTPKLLVRLKMGLRMSNIGIVWELGACSQLSALEGVEGRAEASGLD
jgi:hypothetical protein